MDREQTINIVTLTLTEDQTQEFVPLVRRQVKDRRGLLFMSVAPFFDNGQKAMRMQAKFIDWKTAQRVLKIIRESE